MPLARYPMREMIIGGLWAGVFVLVFCGSTVGDGAIGVNDGFGRGACAAESFGHVFRGGDETGEEFELGCGLSDEHFETTDGWASSFAGIFEEECLFGVVDGVEDEGVIAEPGLFEGGFVDVWVHADGGAVDEDFAGFGGAIFPGCELAVEFGGESASAFA